MSRENSKRYPKSVESKNSFLRIRAPENLDIALEGLIRKVLKEQPKMDDIYAFAADYFDMLLKIREKAGIRKLSAQDICPYHNEDDAHEMVKLASSFTKRTKPHSNTYKVLTLRNPDHSKYKKTSEKLESKDIDAISKENESSDRFGNLSSVVNENTESEKTKNELIESESTDNEPAYSVKVSGQDIGEEVFIRANEVFTEYNAEDEDSIRDILGNSPEPVGDISDLRDKIKAVENEIKLLDNKENKSEKEIADEDRVGEGLENGINETGNLNENSEESELGRSVEDVKEAKENSVETKSQEAREAELATANVEQSEDNDVNVENIDAEKKEEEEKQDMRTNTENEESQKLDVESETKDVGSGETLYADAEKDADAVDDTDAVEKVEETKPNTKIVEEESQSEVEEVKSNGDDEKDVKGTSSEKQTKNKEIPEENPAEMLEQGEALQEEVKEITGQQNLNSEEMGSEKFVQEEREAVKVQDSEVTNADIIEKEDVTSTDENSKVHEIDIAVTDKTAEENSKTEEAETVEKDGTDINVTDSIAPVPLGSTLNGTENFEAPVEESLSPEKILLGDDLKSSEISIATTIEKLLDNEREYSSNEKESEDREPTGITDGNSVESEIVSRTVFELGTIKENEEVFIPGYDTSGKVPGVTQKNDNSEPDNYEDSTTSEEIEFEISPVKYPETDILVSTKITKAENDEIQKKTEAEPEMIPELNAKDQKSEDESKEYKKEPNKVFLEVPQLLLDENLVRKSEDKTETEPVVEEAEDQIPSKCTNYGNEIIQKREVEKVELVEGEEDILQVHLTTTIETEQDPGDSIHVEMTSRIDPDFRVSVETKVESPVQDAGNTENMKLIRAAIIIQNGFRRFKNKKTCEEENKQLNKEHAPDSNENESTALIQTLVDPYEDGNPSLEKEAKRTLNLCETRTLIDTQSLDSVRKISPLKTRSLSSVRYGVADFDVWNQLVKELEEAATKIQSNYRGYKIRKKLQRENAVQSTTTTSEESASMPDVEINHRHTGEFHDTLVLPLDPK